MGLTDLIVVHFAFGSPFAVYRITRGNIRSARSAAAIGAYFALWPIFAAAFIGEWLSKNNATEKIDLEGKIAQLKSSLESRVFSGNSTTVTFEFREIFDRYVGLSLALSSEFSDTAKNLFTISGHKNIALATACVERRRRQKLLFHQKQASSEFVDITTRLAASDVKKDQIILLALQASSLIGDKNTSKKLSAFLVNSIRDSKTLIAVSDPNKRRASASAG